MLYSCTVYIYCFYHLIIQTFQFSQTFVHATYSKHTQETNYQYKAQTDTWIGKHTNNYNNTHHNTSPDKITNTY